jgi:DNA-directed RNA polymerase subunit RPC12/RpoP
MADKVRFRCLNCGNRFEVEVLTEDEKREARRRNQPTREVRCPHCNRADIRRGWE